MKDYTKEIFKTKQEFKLLEIKRGNTDIENRSIAGKKKSLKHKIEILELKSIIESLKCCGNCKHIKIGGSVTGICFECIRGLSVSDFKSDNWEQ